MSAERRPQQRPETIIDAQDLLVPQAVASLGIAQPEALNPQDTIELRRQEVARLRREEKLGGREIAERLKADESGRFQDVTTRKVTGDLEVLWSTDPSLRLRTQRRSKEQILSDDREVKRLTEEEGLMEAQVAERKGWPVHVVQHAKQRQFATGEMQRATPSAAKSERAKLKNVVRRWRRFGWGNKKIIARKNIPAPLVKRFVSELLAEDEIKPLRRGPAQEVKELKEETRALFEAGASFKEARAQARAKGCSVRDWQYIMDSLRHEGASVPRDIRTPEEIGALQKAVTRRHKQGESQREIAERFGISPSYTSKLVNRQLKAEGLL